MDSLLLGILSGVLLGAISIIPMVNMSFENKTMALLSAFINRFSIGFVIGAIHLPLSPWVTGLVVGILLSLPYALITKATKPILMVGAIGGVIIGWVVGH